MAKMDFSSEQWAFLAALDALGGRASVDLVGALAPLPPGPLFDLINRAKSVGLLVQTGPDTFRLEHEALPEAQARLKVLNSPAGMKAVLRRLERQDLLGRVDPSARSGLFRAAGRTYEAAALAEGLAREAVLSGRLAEGLEHYGSALACLEGFLDEDRAGALFVSVALAASRLSFRLGQGLDRLPMLFKKARETAAALGDRRSRVLIGLHMGTFYYLNEALDEALEVMAGELDEVRNLGDEDILMQSAEFFGLYYYLQGRYREATDYFDRAVQGAERRGRFLSYLAGAGLFGLYGRGPGSVSPGRGHSGRQLAAGPTARRNIHGRPFPGLAGNDPGHDVQERRGLVSSSKRPPGGFGRRKHLQPGPVRFCPGLSGMPTGPVRKGPWAFERGFDGAGPGRGAPAAVPHPPGFGDVG